MKGIAIPRWLRWTVPGAAAVAIAGWMLGLSAAVSDFDIAQRPLYQGTSEPPLMMMVMSRDERLFTKAFSDYTDLDGDGLLDVTYKDSFSYEGYFDPGLCYSYSSNRFKAAAQAGGPNGHSCSGQWSGNFLNWVTMSRLDILRYVLYGGMRSTDTNTTVLERAHIPNDLHAWVKVYSGSDIGSFVPGASGTTSFCNASLSSTGEPKMRIASGAWPEWASTAAHQCMLKSQNAGQGSDNDMPPSTTDYTVRVEVCDPNNTALHESFCQRYGASSYKPVGLLQTYGETNKLRFGLLTGSYSNPRDGGILRRNIGRFAGNGNSTSGCAAGDEVDLSNGRFCNQNDGAEGIVNTINRFKLTQWNAGNKVWDDCNTYGILNRDLGSNNARRCSAWGNPLAEMYAEALRYIAGQNSATAAFTGGNDLAGLPKPAWQDPYRLPELGGNSYCAACNILVMSSSLPSFDGNAIPDVPQGIGNGNSLTNSIGSYEGLNGELLVGSATQDTNTAHEQLCSAKNVTALGSARGICPDTPSTEGSYRLAGLAYGARTTDLRPGLQGKPATHRNTVTTYAVALADNLPKFEVPVGGGRITLAPLCQANNSGNAGIDSSGWRSCFLGSVGVGAKTASVSPQHVYGRPLRDDGRAGSFSLVWEDSLWGNDHDNDVVSMLTYCVGSTCTEDTNPRNNNEHSGYDICWRSDSDVCNGGGRPTVNEDEVLVRIENLSAYAGNAMLTGFAVAGSDDDGLKRLALRPGNSNTTILTAQADPPSNWDKPKVLKFKLGNSGARQPESPLWYAAKYGGFKDANGNNRPDSGEWDSRTPGEPDNYFFARDPSKLKREIQAIFEAASLTGAVTGGSGAGSRIGDNSMTVEVGFQPGPEDNPGDWTGYLRAVTVTALGGRGEVLWDAGSKIPSPASRNIYVATQPTQLNATGAVTQAVQAATFTSASLGANNTERLAALGVPSPAPNWLGASPSADTLVSYLRGQAVADYRTRSSLLGDIINSQAEIVTPQDDYGYGFWSYGTGAPAWRAGLGSGYRDYLAAKRTAGRRTIFVGANDGMLHAFDAQMNGAGGTEKFAFVPNGALRHMYELVNPAYDHRYFVDGPIAVGDASFSGTGSGDWRTVLVGSTGAGGAGIAAGSTVRGDGSVFALDVTNPDGFGANNVLWELTGATDDDLGFVLGKPTIVPVAIDGLDSAPRWVALFGNGPNSANGAPVLFVVDIASGAVLARLKPGNSYAGQNGLMNIAPVAVYNSLGVVDTVYGGDLQGNLWKFDLRGTQADWEVAFSGAPLFQARYGAQVQPITGGLEISSGPGGGISVLFGTGRFFVQGDNTDTSVQSLYGIWDNLSDTPVSGRDVLVNQSVSALGAADGYNTRGVGPVPPNSVNYGVHRGWYVDLVVAGQAAAGERFIGAPTLQNGKVIFTTYVPTSAICSAGGGVNWLYALDLLSGTGSMAGISLAPGGEAVCTGNCGAISLNKDDSPQAPVTSTNIFVPKLEGCDPSDPGCTIDQVLAAEKCTFVLRAPGADPLYMPRPCGRQSWRQVR